MTESRVFCISLHTACYILLLEHDGLIVVDMKWILILKSLRDTSMIRAEIEPSEAPSCILDYTEI